MEHFYPKDIVRISLTAKQIEEIHTIYKDEPKFKAFLFNNFKSRHPYIVCRCVKRNDSVYLKGCHGQIPSKYLELVYPTSSYCI